MPASHFGDDGCNYTCTGQAQTCAPGDPPCPEGDLCRPCGLADCEGQPICLDPEQAFRCAANDARSCDGLPHDACDGGWACVDQRCTWACR